ncbi:MAG: transposase [Planctomycetes bacterium]|nr:transposase [Planctomycetota bacterium]
MFAQLCAASVQGRVALGGEERGACGALGRRREVEFERPLFRPGELCCDIEQFSLHAKVRIEAQDREGLERLCRYIARPPIKGERLSLAPDGRVIYALRRHWRDGTSAIAFEPLDFIARLAALVPRPRAHLLTYHGILAPAAEWRDLVVPGPKVKSSPYAEPRSSSPGSKTCTPLSQNNSPQAQSCTSGFAAEPAGEPCAPGSGAEPTSESAGTPLALAHKLRRPTRTSWAELMKRVFEIDVLICPHCGGPRKLIAFLTDGLVVRKILSHLGLPTEPPALAPARAPPEPELAW